MKVKLALTTLALAILGVIATPYAANAKPSVDSGTTLIACPWAKWYMDQREWEYGHRYRDFGSERYDIHDTMIDDEIDMIPEPPKMKTVEQWEGNKKVIRIVPDSGETQVVIFGGGKLNTVEPR